MSASGGKALLIRGREGRGGMSIEGYVICKMVIGSPARVAADEREYIACSSAIDGLQHICDVEEKYENVIENYIEWESVISQHALRQMVSLSIEYAKYQDSRKAIARKLLNLLASTRLFLDSLPKHANGIIPDDEIALKQIKDAPRTQYNLHLSYRLMEALRNYSQHAALPIHGVTTHTSRNTNVEPHILNFAVWPIIDLEQLAKDGDFKKSVLKEISALDKVEMKPLVREYIESISVIHDTFRTTTWRRSKSWLEQLKKSTEAFTREFPDEGTMALAVLPVDDRGFEAGEAVYIAGPMENYLANMREKYSTMVNFTKRRVDF
jgi:hypothetical protein